MLLTAQKAVMGGALRRPKRWVVQCADPREPASPRHVSVSHEEFLAQAVRPNMPWACCFAPCCLVQALRVLHLDQHTASEHLKDLQAVLAPEVAVELK